MKKVDDAQFIQLKNAIKSNETALSLEEDVKQVYSLTDSLAVAQADTLNAAEEHKYREAIVKKLDSLIAIEEAAVLAMRHRMVSAVKDDVLEKFKTDSKSKEAALNQAIAVLAGGKNAKFGTDVVGKAFSQSLVSYKTNYAKQPEGSDEILNQLVKDMKAAAEAPLVETKGSNVFVSHPII